MRTQHGADSTAQREWYGNADPTELPWPSELFSSSKGKQWKGLLSWSVTRWENSFSLQEEKGHLYCWTGTNFPKISIIWYRCHWWLGILVLVGFQSSSGLRDYVHSPLLTRPLREMILLFQGDSWKVLLYAGCRRCLKMLSDVDRLLVHGFTE